MQKKKTVMANNSLNVAFWGLTSKLPLIKPLYQIFSKITENTFSTNKYCECSNHINYFFVLVAKNMRLKLDMSAHFMSPILHWNICWEIWDTTGFRADGEGAVHKEGERKVNKTRRKIRKNRRVRKKGKSMVFNHNPLIPSNK